MRTTRRVTLALLFAAALAPKAHAQRVDPTYFNLLEWRSDRVEHVSETSVVPPLELVELACQIGVDHEEAAESEHSRASRPHAQ